jgi:tight adherence protein B
MSAQEWASVLAAGAVACLLGLPRPGGLRLETVLLPAPEASWRSWTWPSRRQEPGSPPSRSRLRTLLGLGVAMVLALATVLAVAPGSVVPALLLITAGAGAMRVRSARALAAARRLERSRAVEACGTLAAELRSGRPPADALTAAAELASGPSRTALSVAAGAARLGGDAASALRPPDGTAVPEVLRSLAACWTVCAGSGSGLAAAVERLEEGLRADQAQRRAVEAELAGPRATASLLAVLPVTGLLLAAGLGADPVHILLSTPLGLTCLLGGLLLDAAGLWWTGRLVARASERS